MLMNHAYQIVKKLQRMREKVKDDLVLVVDGEEPMALRSFGYKGEHVFLNTDEKTIPVHVGTSNDFCLHKEFIHGPLDANREWRVMFLSYAALQLSRSMVQAEEDDSTESNSISLKGDHLVIRMDKDSPDLESLLSEGVLEKIVGLWSQRKRAEHQATLARHPGELEETQSGLDEDENAPGGMDNGHGVYIYPDGEFAEDEEESAFDFLYAEDGLLHELFWRYFGGGEKWAYVALVNAFQRRIDGEIAPVVIASDNDPDYAICLNVSFVQVISLLKRTAVFERMDIRYDEDAPELFYHELKQLLDHPAVEQHGSAYCLATLACIVALLAWAIDRKALVLSGKPLRILAGQSKPKEVGVFLSELDENALPEQGANTLRNFQDICSVGDVFPLCQHKH